MTKKKKTKKKFNVFPSHKHETREGRMVRGVGNSHRMKKMYSDDAKKRDAGR